VNGREIAENVPRSAPELLASQPGGNRHQPKLLLRNGRQSRQLERFAALGSGAKKYIYGKALFRYWPLTSASVMHHEDVTPVDTPTSPTFTTPEFQQPPLSEASPQQR
jgi:hypothetical protein